jgi:hypothetical protein
MVDDGTQNLYSVSASSGHATRIGSLGQQVTALTGESGNPCTAAPPLYPYRDARLLIALGRAIGFGLLESRLTKTHHNRDGGIDWVHRQS